MDSPTYLRIPQGQHSYMRFDEPILCAAGAATKCSWNAFDIKPIFVQFVDARAEHQGCHQLVAAGDLGKVSTHLCLLFCGVWFAGTLVRVLAQEVTVGWHVPIRSAYTLLMDGLGCSYFVEGCLGWDDDH